MRRITRSKISVMLLFTYSVSYIRKRKAFYTVGFMNLEIWECHQVILLMGIRDSVVGSFLVNPFLCQVQIPLKSCYHQLCVNGRQEKKKENLPDKCLFQKRLYFDARERRIKDRRQNSDMIIAWHHSDWMEMDGSHSTSGGANCDIISDLLFLPHAAWFLLWPRLLLTTNRPRKQAVLSAGKEIGMGKRGRVIRSGFELSTPAPAWWV